MNKKKKQIRAIFFLFLFSITLLSYAQKPAFYVGYSEENEGEELCDFMKQASFTTNKEVKEAVGEILKRIGLPVNFVLVSCPNIKNARAATGDDGLRYIVYDMNFISTIGSGSNTDWAAMSILAHELGHHFDGHTLRPPKTLEEQRKNELQADFFSGFILQRLGSTLEESQIAIKANSADGDDTYSTHPNKEKRLASVTEGYNSGKMLGIPGYINTEPGTEAYFNDGLEKLNNNDNIGAIEEFNKAIELNANNVQAYYNRGQAKKNIKDYDGALADFSSAIALRQYFPEAYKFRGQVNFEKENYGQSLEDLDKAADYFDAPDTTVLFYRGLAKKKLLDYTGAYADFTEALKYAQSAEYYLNRAEIRMFLTDYAGVIDDCTEALKKNNKLFDAYFNRAMAKSQLKDNRGTIEDFTTYLTYKPYDATAKLKIGIAQYNLEEYDNAIVSFTAVINIEPNNEVAYFYRGTTYKQQNKFVDALADIDKAINLGYKEAQIFITKANAYYGIDDFAEALKSVNIAIATDPINSRAYLLRGVIYMQLKENEKACLDFSKSCSLGDSFGCQKKAKYCK